MPDRPDLGAPTPLPKLKRGQHRHHVIDRDTQRRAGGRVNDGRNLLVLDGKVHMDHEFGPRGRLALSALSDEHFAYAAALLGRERAYGYLARHYRGDDHRLDALLPGDAHG